MMWRDVVELLSVENTKNVIGDTITTERCRLVAANIRGVRQNEFYQAAATGFRPELVVEVFAADYCGESKLRHEGRHYSIYRTYPVKGEKLELVCEGLVNRAAAEECDED